MLYTYRDKGDPLDFIYASFRNECYTRNFINNSYLPEPIPPPKQMMVYGYIEVSTDSNEESLAKHKNARANRIQERSIPQSAFPERKEPSFTKLSNIANHKQEKHDKNQVYIKFEPFDTSQIITNSEERKRLYLCLPFKSTTETHLLYSSEKNGKNIRLMHRMIDNMGVTCVIN